MDIQTARTMDSIHSNYNKPTHYNFKEESYSTFKQTPRHFAPTIKSQRGDSHLMTTRVEDYNNPHKYAIKF